jgi:cell division septum initiation protein DivIVA
MRREELLEKGYTEQQVSELLDMFHKNSANLTKQNQDLASQLDTANNQIAGLKQTAQEYDALKQSQMTDSEKLQAKIKEIEEREKNAAKLLSESQRTLNESKAKVILSEIGGVSESVLKSLVTDDEQTTIQNATELLNQFKSFKEQTINKTKEELSSIDIKPTPSNTNQDAGAMDWEKFSALSDEDQIKFQEEHPDEFAKL